MNSVSLVMTIIGQDKPGLVEWISSLVADHDANWLESRMARLGGQFAGILHVAVPSSQHAALLTALKRLEDRGLSITVSTTEESAATETKHSAQLSLVGHDRPGIVRQVSRVLAKLNVNVEELETRNESAPMSGDLLFRAEAKLTIPAQTTIEEMRFELEQVSHDLMVDITVDGA